MLIKLVENILHLLLVLLLIQKLLWANDSFTIASCVAPET